MDTTQDLYQYDEEFRNHIATVDAKGKRIWVHPKKPKGKFHQRRIAVTLFLLGILFAGPFIKIGGQPLLLVNIFERKFVVLGQAFWPQDFVLLALTLITLFVFVILFTVVFGRIWCGWMCPQTLFMEMVFRKIEYLIEGDAHAQRKLAKQPWTTEKILKKVAKQLIFLIISVLIAHTVMAYLIGIEQTIAIVQDSPADHITGFVGLVAFTGIFYFVFAYLREQACIAVCPYGRLQGVLLNKDSIVVAYDWLRGEPRGRLRKSVAPEQKTGDCIDCHWCVHVCPTGIDIRNGTQLECVNCTACIDACDEIMTRVHKPTGLIRYASYNSVQSGSQKLITTRVMGYTFVLLALISLLSFNLITRSDVETTILKVPGTLYQRNDDGTITNLYNVEFVNKTFDEMTLEVRALSPEGASIYKADGNPIVVSAEGLAKSVYFIKIPQDKILQAKTVVEVGVFHKAKQVEKLKVKFIGPVPTSAKH